MPEPIDGDRPTHRSAGTDSFRSGPAPDGPTRADASVDPQADLLDRLRHTPGLDSLVAEAVATWRHRAASAGQNTEETPGWRAFSDAFPTFWEFSNRPR